MPNPHYHLCKLVLAACDFNCKRCGRLTREMPHLIPAHFAYGCCHRCAAYRGCNFMDRHPFLEISEHLLAYDIM